MPYDAQQLLNMSRPELDELFTDSEPGDAPDGEATGSAIVTPGTTFSPEVARFISVFAWQDKIFDAEKGVLRNKILPLGLNAVIAKVYKAKSWLDAKECVDLDYSEASRVYLGKIYRGRQRLIDFALQF